MNEKTITIVERLRFAKRFSRGELAGQAADEIKRLQAIVDKPPTGDEVFEILITYVSQLIRDEKEK